MAEYGQHQTVLKQEVVKIISENFCNHTEGPLLFADLTFGGGGHSRALLAESPHFNVVGFDQDAQAISNGEQMIQAEQWQDRIRLIHSNFENIRRYFDKPIFAGIILDLGVSSHQLDTADRGLSFRADAALDMRMDQTNSELKTASDIVNSASEEELADLIYAYGEDRLSRRIAKAIVQARMENEIQTTHQLENIIFHAYPIKMRHGRIHPATRTFQALRIAVNQELNVLEEVLPQAFELLIKGGRLAVISFHSLEDRIVKYFCRDLQREFPHRCQIYSKKPIIPSAEEIKSNVRARSAKLRVIERCS